tara:strand:+ start:2677 stop:4872 length:2196 start_codon:yes stop_codon:yes gene_type:complete
MTTTSNTVPWAPYARVLMRRLRDAEINNTFDLELDADNEVIAPKADGRRPSAIELLNELERSQRHDTRDLDTMRAAGIDGWALDGSGANQPAQFIEPGGILMALRLAATFGSERNFLTSLRRCTITVVEGFDPDQLSGAAGTIGRLFLPSKWAAQLSAPRGKDTGIIQLIRPFENASGKLTEQAYHRIEKEIVTALPRPHPVMILLPAGAPLPANVRRLLPSPIPLAPIDRDIILALLAQSHSATGKIDRSVVRPLLPGNADLAEMDIPSLFAALRAPTAAAAAEALAGLLASSANVTTDMTLDQIGGDAPAHRAAADIVSDLTAWKHDGAPWSELSHSILFSGEPGTGKTMLARAIAASAGVPIVEGSFGVWQSAGHLGDMLREMRSSFAEAIRKKPSVLFIDEVDAASSRQSADKYGAEYRRQVINQFLSEIDQLQRAEGVVLIGASNHPEALDPAILRPGRFDLHCSLGRPTLAQIRHMLTRAMPDAQEADLTMLARAYSGATPAMIDATIRAAKSSARRMAQPFTPRMLLSVLPASKPDDDRRIAIHECGHAVVATLLGAVPIRRIQVSPDGGFTSRASAIRQGTVPEFEHELTILLGGRAAERALLGSVSAGAGGSEESDLALATKLQLQFDREFGLGINGNAWLGAVDMRRLTPAECDRARVKLDQFERRAQQLIAPHRNLLERLADHLVQHRELGEDELRPWLGELAPSHLKQGNDPAVTIDHP